MSRKQVVMEEDPLLFYDKQQQPIGHVLRNLWGKGSAAFLVCGGPSLNKLPLEKLQEKGICTLGLNNASGLVKTNVFCCSDPPGKFHHGIWFDPSIMKLVPTPKLKGRIRIKNPDGSFTPGPRVRDCPNVFGFKRICEYYSDKFLTEDGATWGNNNAGVAVTKGPKILFTFFIALRLMHYLGVRRVYMLGVDFQMKPGGREVGNYAFPQAGAGNGNNNHYVIATELLSRTKPHLEEMGFQLFNCNPDSRLLLFPYVPFDIALEDCRGKVPKESLDLGGWYEK